MLTFFRQHIFMHQNHIIARLLASMVVILGVLSLGTGLLRLFFSGVQHQEEWIQYQRILGLNRFWKGECLKCLTNLCNGLENFGKF